MSKWHCVRRVCIFSFSLFYFNIRFLLPSFTPTGLAVLARLYDTEKATLLVKARQLVTLTKSNASSPSYLQHRVLHGQPLPGVTLVPLTEENNSESDEEECKFRRMLAFVVGMGGGPKGQDMPRACFWWYWACCHDSGTRCGFMTVAHSTLRSKTEVKRRKSSSKRSTAEDTKTGRYQKYLKGKYQTRHSKEKSMYVSDSPFLAGAGRRGMWKAGERTSLEKLRSKGFQKGTEKGQEQKKKLKSMVVTFIFSCWFRLPQLCVKSMFERARKGEEGGREEVFLASSLALSNLLDCRNEACTKEVDNEKARPLPRSTCPLPFVFHVCVHARPRAASRHHRPSIFNKSLLPSMTPSPSCTNTGHNPHPPCPRPRHLRMSPLLPRLSVVRRRPKHESLPSFSSKPSSDSGRRARP